MQSQFATLPQLLEIALQPTVRMQVSRALLTMKDSKSDNRLFKDQAQVVHDLGYCKEYLQDKAALTMLLERFYRRKKNNSRPAIATYFEKTKAWLEKEGQSLILLGDSQYPPLLSQIPDPPLFLFVKGTSACLKKPMVAIIGSRTASDASLEAASYFSQTLASHGWLIVSGLARGVDAAAHRGALHGSGSTVAVFGCGLGQVYPAMHRSLAEEIVATGAVLSEYPIGIPPLPQHFPTRNRIIAGLASVVIVVEASLKSGSLSTAKSAFEYNRDVFAIPGPINNTHHDGCHRLIQESMAMLVTKPDDIYKSATLPSEIVQPKNKPSRICVDSLTPVATMIFKSLRKRSLTVPQLQSLSQENTNTVLAALMELECTGLITQDVSGSYRITMRNYYHG